MEVQRADITTDAPGSWRTRRQVFGLLATLPLLGPVIADIGALAGAERAEATPRRQRAGVVAEGTCAQKCSKKHGGKARKGCKRRCQSSRSLRCPERTIPVDGECQPCTVCVDPGCPVRDVQAALDAAAPGATVYLCPGKYSPQSTVARMRKSVTLIGAGADATMLWPLQSTNPDTLRSVLVIEPGADVVLRNLTVRGGMCNAIGLSGCGAGIANRGNLRLGDVVVTDNTAQTSGAGIKNDGTLELGKGTRVVNNRAALGGGIYNSGRVIRKPGSEVSGNTPEQCFELYGGGRC